MIAQRKRMSILDLKIKLLFLLKYFEDGLTYIFPANSPGDFNSPLGLKRAIDWDKRVKQKDKLMAWFAILLITPIGWYGVFTYSGDIFSVLFIIWGASAALYLKSMPNEEVQKNKEKISILENEIKKLKEK